MGLISGLIEVGSSICSAACSVISNVGGRMLTAASGFLSKLPLPIVGLPPLSVEIMITIACKVISAVAKLLVDAPEKETPEEIGMKAEETEMKEGESVDDYLKRLREEATVDQEKLNALSEKERAEYAAIGAALYVQQMEERFGTKYPPEFWRTVECAGMTAATVAKLVIEMKNREIEDAAVIYSYLNDQMKPGSKEMADTARLLVDVCGGISGLEQLMANYKAGQERVSGGTER